MNLKCFLAMEHVLVAPSGRSGGTVDAALADRGLARKVTCLVPYFMVALDIVSRTNWVLTVSERRATAYAERYGLQVLKPPLALPAYTICQVWHPRVDADPSHRWLRRWVVQAATELTRRRAR